MMQTVTQSGQLYEPLKCPQAKTLEFLPIFLKKWIVNQPSIFWGC